MEKINTNIKNKLLECIKGCYTDTSLKIRLGVHVQISSSVKLKKGVSQGIQAPLLFNLYINVMIEFSSLSIEVGGKTITVLLYADDT